MINQQQDEVICYYYEGTEILRQQYIISRQHPISSRISYYDYTGKEMYAVTFEHLSDLHKQHYYNDTLVAVGILCEDEQHPTVSATYFYANGTKMIELILQDDHTGEWKFYSDAGTVSKHLPITAATSYRLKCWDIFLPDRVTYNEDYTKTDWESIEELFNEYHDKYWLGKRLADMDVPPLSDNYNLIHGMLSEDEALATFAEEKIWSMLNDWETAADVPCKTAIIVAQLFSHYNYQPAIQTRLAKFVSEVLHFTSNDDNEALYTVLINTVQPWLPTVINWAQDTDDQRAQIAQYILVHAGETTATAQLLTDQWQHNNNSNARKAYAVFSLGYLYTKRGLHEKLQATFSPAFETTTDIFLRFSIAAQLVHVTNEKYLSALIQPLISGYDPYFNMPPYLPYDLQRYIFSVLDKTVPSTVAKLIGPVVTPLSRIDEYVYFNLVFKLYFKDSSWPNNITPVRKTILLIAAAAVKNLRRSSNRQYLFQQYDIPHNASLLTQLANG